MDEEKLLEKTYRKIVSKIENCRHAIDTAKKMNLLDGLCLSWTPKTLPQYSLIDFLVSPQNDP